LNVNYPTQANGGLEWATLPSLHCSLTLAGNADPSTSFGMTMKLNWAT